MRYIIDVRSGFIIDICWKKLFKRVGIENFESDDILSNYLYFERGIYNDKSRTFIFKLKVFPLLKLNYLGLFKKLKKELSKYSFIKYYNYRKMDDIFIILIKDIDLRELLSYLNEFYIYNRYKLLKVKNIIFQNNKIGREYTLKYLSKKFDEEITIKYLYENMISIFYIHKKDFKDIFIELEREKDDEMFQLYIGYKNIKITLTKLSNTYFIKHIYKSIEGRGVSINYELPIKEKSFINKLESYICDYKKFIDEFLIKFMKNYDIDKFIKEYKKVYKNIINQIDTILFTDIL